MKRALIVAGLLVVIVAGALVGYVAWFVRRAVSDRVEVRASVPPQQGPDIAVEVVVEGTEDPVFITVISMERSLQEALGLSPPDGFTAEALPLDERERDDPDSIEFVAKYNREKVRYVGKRVIKPGQGELLRFRVERPTAAPGEIHFQHEKKVGVGGSIGFVSVKVGPSDGSGRP